MRRAADLSDSVQDLAVAVGRRIIALDVSGLVVAYSIHETPADRRRLADVLTHSDVWPRPIFRDGVCRSTIHEYGAVLFIALQDGGQFAGSLLITLEGPTDDLDAEQLGRLRATAVRLAPLVRLRELSSDHDRRRSRQLLTSLVGRDPDLRASAGRALLEEELVGASGRYCAVVLGPATTVPPGASGEGGDRAALAVEATLTYLARTSTATMAGAGIAEGLGLLVFPRPVVLDRLRAILVRPELSGTLAGVGPLVPALEDVWRSFTRARDALRVSQLTPDIAGPAVRWDDLGVDRLLIRLPLADLTRDDLPGGLQALMTDRSAALLLETLDAYLAAGCDAQATARHLVIHRSTLYYRLDRIKALIDADLSDGRLRRDLHTGLRLAQLAGLWRPRG